MPIETVILDSRLILRLEGGVDDEGETIVLSRSFNRLKPEASNGDVKEVAESLASLQVYPLLQVVRLDENRLN